MFIVGPNPKAKFRVPELRRLDGSLARYGNQTYLSDGMEVDIGYHDKDYNWHREEGRAYLVENFIFRATMIPDPDGQGRHKREMYFREDITGLPFVMGRIHFLEFIQGVSKGLVGIDVHSDSFTADYTFGRTAYGYTIRLWMDLRRKR